MTPNWYKEALEAAKFDIEDDLDNIRLWTNDLKYIKYLREQNPNMTLRQKIKLNIISKKLAKQIKNHKEGLIHKMKQYKDIKVIMSAV